MHPEDARPLPNRAGTRPMSASTKRVPTRYFVRLLDTLQAQAVDTA